MIYPFPSIEYPDSFGFCFDTETSFSDDVTSCHFRGHKENKWSIAPKMLADYLASLAQAMLSDLDLARAAWAILETKPSVEAIQFASTLICSPTDRDGSIKRRFWSLELRKVSSNLALQHDKRYEPMAEWMNGSPEAIVRILTPSYAGAFERYCYVEAVREWILSQLKSMDMPGVFMGWFTEHLPARKLHSAFVAARSSAQVYYHRNSAVSQLDCYRLNFKLPAAA